jgi:AraC-like DNA-binding protein
LSDRQALKAARHRCDSALERLTAQGSLAAWITLMIEEANDHQPRQVELARLLHVSTRTMNRRLSMENTNFRELGNRARHARACRLLDDPGLAITTIAFQLGYRDAANFTRAFRRQQDMSPFEFRNRPTDGSVALS